MDRLDWLRSAREISRSAAGPGHADKSNQSTGRQTGGIAPSASLPSLLSNSVASLRPSAAPRRTTRRLQPRYRHSRVASPTRIERNKQQSTSTMPIILKSSAETMRMNKARALENHEMSEAVITNKSLKEDLL
uniref:Uncharacterized protein n=1 Tax=Odontella aurita TaxID=265563 RepID=A0A7S4KCJ9_9STRA|mmetsp:Transcript_9470/g.28456  ORF Transcript_9470/g.28456 Transcript_9470/m.28456 type:complete len:133 (+) Transcript_9470:185-583(+)